MRELEGRMVIVTGVCGVLGSAVSELLAVRGARVVGFDRAENNRRCKVDFAGVDLADETACRRAVDSAVARSGPLYGLVNIAGGFEMGTLAEGGPGMWDRMYHMNLRTALCASSAAIPHFSERCCRPHRQCWRRRGGEGRGSHGRLRRCEIRRRASHREPGRGMARRRRHRQCGGAQYHRHACQSGRHAGCRFYQMDVAGGDCARDRLSAVGRSVGGDRRGNPRDGRKLNRERRRADSGRATR